MVEQIGEWVGDPQGGRYDDEDDETLIEARKKGTIEVIADVGDNGYDWERRAIARVGRRWYFVGASGCSCTMPSEQWRSMAVGSLSVVRKAIVDGEYSGYSLIESDREALLAAIDARRRAVN